VTNLHLRTTMAMGKPILLHGVTMFREIKLSSMFSTHQLRRLGLKDLA